ncbi:hypothetical protein LBMAG53_06350 [Planctomycetota bacterium]|nr:hypothetical protein LBMAG53_06350 [Planctomycetota bacterium]
MVQLNFGRANPLGKARKHIEHDASESIFGFYLSTIALVNQHAGKHGTQEKVRKEPDGAVINESYSTNAPHVKASLWRLMKHDDDLRLWSNLILIAGFGVFFLSVWGARLISQDQVLWGGILLALGIALLVFLLYFSILFLRALHMTRVMFYNALLSPAMIISLDPLKLACVAEMGNGRDGDYWGWKMREVKDLPGHHRQLHEIIPCVSVFRDGPGDHHADFDPRPICWGTSDKKEVERCLQKTDREALEQLQMLIRDGNFAQLSDEVRIVGH